MRVLILDNKEKLSKKVAEIVAKRINDFNPTEDKPFVLGLPTGSTPILVYKELIELNKKGAVSFKNVVTFNMDEYVGLDENHEQSYHYFMYETFFNHIDIKKENINILDGMAKDIKLECARYEEKIKSYGGIHLFLGGVGEDGHIAFNEPGSSLMSRTRDKELTEDTILVNSRFFGGDVTKVPKLALTVGVGTIMDSNEVLIMANGTKKAEAIRRGIEEGINHMWTISMLQMHRNAIIVIDEEAANNLMLKTYKYFKDIEKDNIK
ncbi:glucosamine-6-phosphate deaminase [Oceanivirga miroungae]|uniref:Glucosamine-6-phosphate deaminase n=1 Tax=Oceanivirga miroungae TaxID=1130046 RepID=A0A6I8M8H4_9FUSO|nr:glucosamine-6-phosphate deaminase [Oceanivirga miroungae]VWL85114.1 glucosamine-6-phosphate deaminase [Oceanivirga miroungae]